MTMSESRLKGIKCVFSDQMDVKLSFSHGGFATVFQTEIHAILACSVFCASQRLSNYTICICSDSQAALLALGSYTTKSKLVLQYWQSLQEISADNTVLLFWVPGHCGVLGNEEADTLAGNGSRKTPCGPEPFLPMSQAITKLEITDWASTTHGNMWNSTRGCRQSKLCIEKPCMKLAKYLRNLPRVQLGILIGLITGHVRLNEHMFKMALVTDPLCQSYMYLYVFVRLVLC